LSAGKTAAGGKLTFHNKLYLCAPRFVTVSKMESVPSSLSSTGDDQMLILVKVNGLHSKPSALSKYKQLQFSTGHTFGDLLYLLLDERKASETLSESKISYVLRINVMVLHQNHFQDEDHYQNQNTNGDLTIGANLGASCLGLKLTGNHVVHYEFKEEASPPQKESIHPSHLLLPAQTRRVFPDQYENPVHFPMKIYNFIIDDLVNGDCSVPIYGKDKVAKLCRAIRDTPVLLESRVATNRLPIRFQHTFQQFGSRDRTTTSRLIQAKAAVIASVRDCQAIFLTQRWIDFYTNVKTLLLLLEQAIWVSILPKRIL
jgi:hypothetical protein